jgi:hypothetical protein
MKERQMLFSDLMVRALLNGSKTQTRRVVKRQVLVIDCPYGWVGDRLWVREAWSIDALGAFGTPNGYDSTYELSYRAGGDEREIHVAPGEPDPYIKLYDSQRGDWRPSIHMPRWASRILLEIVSVRVERLNDCNEGDAIAEGIAPESDGWTDYSNPTCQMCASPVDSYRTLWEQINGAGSWAANPWVWVVEFKRVTS